MQIRTDQKALQILFSSFLIINILSNEESTAKCNMPNVCTLLKQDHKQQYRACTSVSKTLLKTPQRLQKMIDSQTQVITC